MAIKIELPKEILTSCLDQGIAIRKRNINNATNTIIKQALQQEMDQIILAKSSLVDQK